MLYGSSPSSLPHPVVTRTLGTKCYGCNREKDDTLSHTLQKCGGCHVMTYCSKECQKAHWNEHKSFCKMIKACPANFSFYDLEGYAYRRYQVYEATKHVPENDIATKTRIEMSFTRDLLMEYNEILKNNPHTVVGTKYFEFEPLASFKEALLCAPDMGRSHRDQSIAFFAVPQAPLMLFRCCYQLMDKFRRCLLGLKTEECNTYHFIVRDFFRGLSQMLCHRDAALQFARLLEADLPSMPTTPSPSAIGKKEKKKQAKKGPMPPSDSIDHDACLLKLFVAFLTEIDDIADDVEGLTWECLALVSIFIERDPGNQSQIVQGVLNQVVLTGESVGAARALLEYAKMHARNSIVRSG